MSERTQHRPETGQGGNLSPESQICTLSRVDVSDIGSQVQSGRKGLIETKLRKADCKVGLKFRPRREMQ